MTENTGHDASAAPAEPREIIVLEDRPSQRKAENTQGVKSHQMNETKDSSADHVNDTMLDCSDAISDNHILHLVDSFFLKADKNITTASDINRSVAREFGLDKFRGLRKEMIKNRLVGLVSTVLESSMDQSGKSRKRAVHEQEKRILKQKIERTKPNSIKAETTHENEENHSQDHDPNTVTLDVSDVISDNHILHLVDSFFLKADKNITTASDINRSVAREFGLDKFRGLRKEMIKNRLVGLVADFVKIGDQPQRCIQPGPGLQNPKNLCYMNTVIQLLYGMRCTRELFLIRDFQKLVDPQSSSQKSTEFGEKGGIIANALHLLFLKMKSKSSNPTVAEFKEALVSNRLFQDYDNDHQHDANELLTRLLDMFSEVLCNEAGDPISRWFRSRAIGWVRCQTCNNKTTNQGDLSTSLEVPISGTNIETCLSKYFGRGDIINDWTCCVCNCKRPARKGLFLEPRPILIVALKRYNCKGHKSNSRVSFPLDNLDISSYMEGTDFVQLHNYRLVAVINHYGKSPGGGHYDLFMDVGEASWYRFNDERVVQIQANELVTESAYTLVYCRHDNYTDLI